MHRYQAPRPRPRPKDFSPTGKALWGLRFGETEASSAIRQRNELRDS